MVFKCKTSGYITKTNIYRLGFLRWFSFSVASSRIDTFLTSNTTISCRFFGPFKFLIRFMVDFGHQSADEKLYDNMIYTTRYEENEIKLQNLYGWIFDDHTFPSFL